MITYQVKSEDISSYWRDGYWISPKLIDDSHILRLRKALDRLFSGDFDGHGSLYDGALTLSENPYALKRVVNSWWVNDDIKDIILNPGIGRIAAALMKVGKVRLWGDQTIIKPGNISSKREDAGNVGWHQDAAYWHINSKHNNMITAWIALQDTDLSNGGMRTLVGSHRWGLIKESDRFYDPDLGGQREFFEKEIGGDWIDEPCLLKAGQISFHHSLCFHGSGENLTRKPRMSIIGHYMPDGSSFTPSGKFQAFLRLLGPRPVPGQLFTDPIFPEVFSQAEIN